MNKLYTPELYKLIKPGDRIDAVITQINEGLFGQFDIKGKDKWEHVDDDDPFIEVVFENIDFGITKTKMVSLPRSHIVHGNSILYKWKKLYGDYPKVSQRIFLVANEDGLFEPPL